jgi:hypothetical protein
MLIQAWATVWILWSIVILTAFMLIGIASFKVSSDGHVLHPVLNRPQLTPDQMRVQAGMHFSPTVELKLTINIDTFLPTR